MHFVIGAFGMAESSRETRGAEEIKRRMEMGIRRALSTPPTSVKAAEKERKAKKSASKSAPAKPKSA